MLFPRSCVLAFVFLSLLLQSCVQSKQEILLEESAQVESLHAPTAGDVELPCDVTPALTDDRMGLVIWYKQGHTSPIYTLDTREGVTSHWSDPKTFSSRATFRSNTSPAFLVLTKLRPEDSGQYRCRVDFIKSPTKNTRLSLTVLVPPERLIILNHEGHEVQSGVLGPYDEGTNVNLTCIAVGGQPTAKVSWWKSHALLANSEARVTVSFRLERADFGTHVTCQAVTDPSLAPMSVSLSVDVNLRPLWLRLQGGKRPLVAGQSTELVCQAVGARPKPSISWWMGGSRLKTARESTSVDGNTTNSILTFVPAIEDAGGVLSCRAVQPTIPDSTQEDGWKMDIQHFPVVKLELGANLDASKLVEGSDVYLDCRVRANPWHSHVYFTHNGVVVKPDPGVLLANQSLVLQRVSRNASGAYGCSARNSLGEGSSEQLVLDVKYAPICRSLQPAVMRAARGEVLEINCNLDANPRESMSFKWWFNSSTYNKHELYTGAVNIAQTPPVTRSFLYTVNTSADYGWVQCSGTNSVGRQTKPCLYHILPADKPSSLKACEITNVTYDSLTLNCTPGHDGGIRQSFLLQIFDMGTGLLLANISNEEPEFQVSGLSASNSLSVAVRAFNKKGSSKPLTLSSSLLKYPQRHTAQVPVKVELTTVLLIVLGSFGVIVSLTAVSATIFCCRNCNKKNNENEKDKRQQDETSNIPLTDTKESESVDCLDKNPDIIPLDGKISASCSNESSTTDYSSIRPLISKSSSEKYTYHRNIDQCNQYIQVRPIEYRIRPHYQSNSGAQQNLGPSIQSLNSMSTMGNFPSIGPNDCYMQRPPHDKVYEDCLKYKNVTPLSTSSLLPVDQLLSPELYMTPSTDPNRNPFKLSQMHELDRYHLDPRNMTQAGGTGDSRSCSNSPPVRFNTDTSSVHFKQGVLDRTTNTLPHFNNQRINNENEKDKRQQDETLNIPLTDTKESESVDCLDKNPDIIPLDGKISDNCSNKSSTNDYSSIRPLISKSSSDKYYSIPPNCDRYTYHHNIDQWNQYIQVRPIEYRIRPHYQSNSGAQQNLGSSLQSLNSMSTMGNFPSIGPNDCYMQRPSHDTVYEDCLKYKNILPLSTSSLLPSPELYTTLSPHSLHSNTNRNPFKLSQMHELDRYHLDPRNMTRAGGTGDKEAVQTLRQFFQSRASERIKSVFDKTN